MYCASHLATNDYNLATPFRYTSVDSSRSIFTGVELPLVRFIQDSSARFEPPCWLQFAPEYINTTSHSRMRDRDSNSSFRSSSIKDKETEPQVYRNIIRRTLSQIYINPHQTCRVEVANLKSPSPPIIYQSASGSRLKIQIQYCFASCTLQIPTRIYYSRYSHNAYGNI
jgi:hypothetical protein